MEQGQVFAQGSGEEVSLLRDQHQMPGAVGQFADGHAAQPDFAGVRWQQAGEQTGEGRFPDAARADHREVFAGAQVEVQAVDDRFRGGAPAEGQVAHGEAESGGAFGRWAAFGRGGGFGELGCRATSKRRTTVDAVAASPRSAGCKVVAR